MNLGAATKIEFELWYTGLDSDFVDRKDLATDKRGGYFFTATQALYEKFVEAKQLRAALSITRGQWYHSVNREICLKALGEDV